MKHSPISVATAAAIDAVKSDQPTVEIQHYAPAGSGLARFVGRVIHTAKSRADDSLVLKAIRDRFDGRMCAVAGSVQVVDKGPVSDTVTGVLSVVRESIAVASSEDMNGFRAIASNMFLDEEDRMWTLNKTEAGSLLIRSNGIDDDQALLGMLHAVASSAATSMQAQQLAAVASSVKNQIEAGKFASYVNVNNELATGFIVAVASDENSSQVVILPGADAEAESVDANAVVEVQDVPNDVLPSLSEDEQIQISIAASRGAVNIEMMLDYYRKVFGHRPDYYDQLAQRIRSHAFAA